MMMFKPGGVSRGRVLAMVIAATLLLIGVVLLLVLAR